MNRSYFLIAVTLCALVPVTTSAQDPPSIELIIDCGGVAVASNVSHQFGDYAWLEYIVETRRSLNTCPLGVQAEAWVVGVENSALVQSAFLVASARRQVPVPAPFYRRWQTNGKHWLIVPIFGWFDLGSTASHATIVPPPVTDPAYECEVLLGGRWGGGTCELPNCPLIVDTARDGLRLTSLDDGVRFDLNADGIAEQVSWTRPDSDDAFLALDRNGNGRIDDGSELFGNHTPAYGDRSDVTTANGFEALKFTEGPSYGGGYPDRQIDKRDPVFSRLLFWRDDNHNGISEPEELRAVQEAGLNAIRTEYKNRKRVDRHGNEFRQHSRVEWEDGAFADIFDVWLTWRD
jgi:hypothetical protein